MTLQINYRQPVSFWSSYMSNLIKFLNISYSDNVASIMHLLSSPMMFSSYWLVKWMTDEYKKVGSTILNYIQLTWHILLMKTHLCTRKVCRIKLSITNPSWLSTKCYHHLTKKHVTKSVFSKCSWHLVSILVAFIVMLQRAASFMIIGNMLK